MPNTTFGFKEVSMEAKGESPVADECMKQQLRVCFDHKNSKNVLLRPHRRKRMSIPGNREWTVAVFN
jgi:hypothetical protein